MCSAGSDAGTNPANFTYDLRFITETQWFRADGGSLADTCAPALASAQTGL